MTAASGNTPKLKDAHPPFERPPQSLEDYGRLLQRFPELITYYKEHGSFVVPRSVDAWEYRGLLHTLDPVCMRALKGHGALTAGELADWVNRNGHLHTKPKTTGITTLTAETASDWIELAARRDLIAAWPSSLQPGESEVRTARWTLTDRGRGALRSPAGAIAARVPWGPVVTLVVGGGLGAIAWLERHETALFIVVVIVGFLIYIGLLAAISLRSKRRNGPSIAVVTIETFRSANRPLPSLEGASLVDADRDADDARVSE